MWDDFFSDLTRTVVKSNQDDIGGYQVHTLLSDCDTTKASKGDDRLLPTNYPYQRGQAARHKKKSQEHNVNDQSFSQHGKWLLRHCRFSSSLYAQSAATGASKTRTDDYLVSVRTMISVGGGLA